MTKFWSVVTVIFLTSIVLLVTNMPGNTGISFTDLETECRYDRGNMTNIGLEGQRITFSGHFNTPNPNTNLDYSYDVSSSNQVSLNVFTSDTLIPDTFYDSCLASVVYDFRTDRLENGNYTVSVYHNGDIQDRVRIRIK